MWFLLQFPVLHRVLSSPWEDLLMYDMSLRATYLTCVNKSVGAGNCVALQIPHCAFGGIIQYVRMYFCREGLPEFAFMTQVYNHDKALAMECNVIRKPLSAQLEFLHNSG